MMKEKDSWVAKKGVSRHSRRETRDRGWEGAIFVESMWLGHWISLEPALDASCFDGGD